MKVVFLGTPREAVPTLTALLRSDHDVPLVVTRPDRPVGRSARLVAPPVKAIAAAAGIPVFQPRKVRDAAFRETLAAAAADVLVVVAYGRILPGPVLRLTPGGAINVHFSLLPALRGAAPVQWALARGLRSTGVTTMQMSEGLDEGDVLVQRELVVEPLEHAPALAARLADLGAELLMTTLNLLVRGELSPSPQDPEAASYAPILTKEQGEVDPVEQDAGEIEGRVRGFDPWPGVWMAKGGRRIRLLEARRVPRRHDAPPGTVVLSPDAVDLACAGDTTLELRVVQPEGRRRVSARDAVNGRLLANGDRLGSPRRAG